MDGSNVCRIFEMLFTCLLHNCPQCVTVTQSDDPLIASLQSHQSPVTRHRFITFYHIPISHTLPPPAPTLQQGPRKV